MRFRPATPRSPASGSIARSPPASTGCRARGRACWLDLGAVYVDGTRVKIASRPVRAGQRIEAVIGSVFERATSMVGAAARRADEARLPAFTILHEDDDVLVVDKPAGLPSRRRAKATSAAVLLRRRGETPVFLVHRLDVPTSGVLVYARTAAANRTLAAAFARHDVRREYLALRRRRAGRRDARARCADRGRAARTHVQCGRAPRKPRRARSLSPGDGSHAPDPHPFERRGPSGAGRHPVFQRVRRCGRLAWHCTPRCWLRTRAAAAEIAVREPVAPDLSDYLDRLRSATLPR
jgi:hypothetical protein